MGTTSHYRKSFEKSLVREQVERSSVAFQENLPAFTTRPRRLTQAGFTFIELLITMAIILTLSAIASVQVIGALDQARIAKATGDIHAIGTDIQGYYLSNNVYPNTLADVGYGTYNDPWGNPYQYLNFAGVNGKGKMRKDRFLVPINTFFDLYSMGPDGQSVPPLTAKQSQDDIIWADDGDYVGPASAF